MPKSRCSNVTAFLLVKSYQLVGWVERSETQQVGESRGERGKLARVKGKVSESKGEGSYQLVGWVERSETQQVSELLGERGKLRVSRCEL